MRAGPLIGVFFSVTVAFCAAALAQDDPMDAVAEQAAVLEAAPVLSSGTLSLDEPTATAGAFVWLAVESDGLYTLTTDKPGALVLGGIPTPDGRFDGTTPAQNYISSTSLDEPPAIGPVLLTTAQPYLLSVSSQAGAATLALTLDETVPEISAAPAEEAPIPDGDALFAPEPALDLSVAGSSSPRRIEVIAEPRATLSAELGGQDVFSDGLYPWLSEEATPLEISARVGGTAPPARVLVRIGPSDAALDESEPNHHNPNTLNVGTPFDGHLLRGDADHLAFSLTSESNLSLDVATNPTPGMGGAKFSLRLSRVSEQDTQQLWNREPGARGLAGAALQLAAGVYRLELKREDGQDAPLPYTLTLSEASAPGANDEVEPNDYAGTAMPFPGSLRVSGSATPDDTDYYSFTVPDDKPQHLWRIFGVDVGRIELRGDEGNITTVHAKGRRTTIDSLALEPDTYTLIVKGESDYLLRVMDLGERPSDFEGEPNNSAADGQRLEMGEGVRGGFHSADDIDYYLFRLDAPSPVEINIRPAGDGEMDVKLYLGNHQLGRRIVFEPGDGPYQFRSTLPAGDWSLAVRAQSPTIQEQYELSVARLPALAGNEPDDDPLSAIKLPRDGDLEGSVGAFDAADQVLVPLPQGEGLAAMVCAVDSASDHGRWRLHRWSDGTRVEDIRDGIAPFQYSPELGGAVRFGMSGNNTKIDYQCSLRFPPLDEPPPAEAASEGAPTVLPPGKTLRLTVEAEGPEPQVALDLEANDTAFIGCRDETGNWLTPNTRVWSVNGARKTGKGLFGNLQPILAESEPTLRLSRTYVQRLEGATLPFDADCTLYGVDHLARPSDMGPPAELRIVEQMTAAADAAEGPATGLPPPGLEALIAREAPDRQPQGDLPLEISFGDLPELAAFNAAGQRFEASVILSNESGAALMLALDASVDGEGWRLQPQSQSVAVQPGATEEVTISIVAPPWLSPSLRPSLAVKASAQDSFAAAMMNFPVSATAVPVNPFVYWHAPDALRGGLNVAHYGLGARLIEWGEDIPDENKQRGERRLHDGLAPHIDSVNVQKTIALRLAATAELAGIMLQMRSTSGQQTWPAEVEVFSPDEQGEWARVASSLLDTVHAPQYLVFETPVTTDRLRFHFPRCFDTCRYPFIQEIQAIAVPGTHPEGLPPINAADPELGGQVVWSTERFPGQWNQEFLVGVPTASNKGWPGAGSEPASVTVAFHQNRAALVQSVTWIADPDDPARIPEAELETSLEGPNGPWKSIGALVAPPIGEVRSTLELGQPRWVRYLRFTFEIPEEGSHYGPDAIEVTEATGTSVLGLWEDDQPQAAYEAQASTEPPSAVPPAGGPDQDSAVALPLDAPVRSSVVIERNEDWWRFEVPEGEINELRLTFERALPLVVAELHADSGAEVALEEDGRPGELVAVLDAGAYDLRIYEPPRSVVISWDTSGSVAQYIPRTLAAVRTWGRGLKPGRDALQLLPFGPKGFILEDWAESPAVLEPALANLPEEDSSDSEKAMMDASKALSDRQGSRGIVIMTDAETGMNPDLWPAMLEAMPRVVSLSMGSDSRQNAAIMMNWANVNGGHFRRVIGPLGLADSMEMANALFRAPKAYELTASLEELVEVEGEAQLTISMAGEAGATGAVELILDASGSMLQRMEGKRRIDVAHQALTGLVRDTLPEGMPFAFRAFGLEEDACRSELIVPLGPLDRDAAARAIEEVPAINLAKTAIADSLRAAAGDLADSAPPRVVVLVTDGEETCEGDPEAAIAELRESGLDARVNIVGFAIDDEALAETFANWAESGGGTYFDARGAEALEQSIADALKPRFDITRTYLDGRQEVVGRIALGETVTVPAGQLTIAPGSAATGDAITLQVQPSGSVSLDYTPGSGLTESQ